MKKTLRIIVLLFVSLGLVSCKSPTQKALEEAQKRLDEQKIRAKEASDAYDDFVETYKDYQETKKKLGYDN